jgi:PAS domain S-box-containing protein
MEIVKYRSQLFAASEQVALHLRQAQNTLARLGRYVAEGLQHSLRARKNKLRDLLASSHHAIGVTRGKIIKCRSQLFATSERVTFYIRQVQKTPMRLGRSVADRLQGAFRAKENDLRDLLASSHHAIGVTRGKIIKCRSQLLAASEQSTAYLRRTQNTLSRLARSVAEKPRRLQKARRARENNLRKLLASSLDAIVVMDVDRRFVAANPKALDLFGVSETNMRKFTIDAFLSRGQIPYFEGNGSPFKGRQERHGECKIRRLDGKLRIAECIFVANFAPYQHLCRFHNVRTAQVKFIAAFNSGHGNDSNTVQTH